LPDIVLYDGGGTLTQQEEELLWERVVSHYLRLQEERKGRKVKVDEALTACLDAHPNEYSEVVAKAAIKSKDFDDYLAARRKEHMLHSLVPVLYAAEAGLHLGQQAAEELSKRLDSEVVVSEMSDKDLIAIMKTGFEMAAKADKQVEEVTETQNVKINLDLKGLLVGLPPEMAADYMAEIGRRMIADGKK
jgi:hypothetical protein